MSTGVNQAQVYKDRCSYCDVTSWFVSIFVLEAKEKEDLIGVPEFACGWERQKK